MKKFYEIILMSVPNPPNKGFGSYYLRLQDFRHQSYFSETYPSNDQLHSFMLHYLMDLNHLKITTPIFEYTGDLPNSRIIQMKYDIENFKDGTTSYFHNIIRVNRIAEHIMEAPLSETYLTHKNSSIRKFAKESRRKLKERESNLKNKRTRKGRL